MDWGNGATVPSPQLSSFIQIKEEDEIALKTQKTDVDSTCQTEFNDQPKEGSSRSGKLWVKPFSTISEAEATSSQELQIPSPVTAAHIFNKTVSAQDVKSLNSFRLSTNTHSFSSGSHRPISQMTDPPKITGKPNNLVYESADFPKPGVNQLVAVDQPCKSYIHTSSLTLGSNESNPRLRVSDPSTSTTSTDLGQYNQAMTDIKVESPIDDYRSASSKYSSQLQSNCAPSENVKPEIDLGMDIRFLDEEDIKLEELDTNSEAAMGGTLTSPPQIPWIQYPGIDSHSEISEFPTYVASTSSQVKNEPGLSYPQHEEVGKYICRACDYKTNDICGLQSHANCLHTPENRFRCARCLVEHESFLHLIYHFAVVHRGEAPMSVLPETKKVEADITYSCHKCEFTCKSQKSLNAHIQSHMLDEKVPCQYCGKNVRRRAMTHHITSVHLGEKRYRCSECNFGTDNRQIMRTHYSRTKHDKPFPCKSCRSGFSTAEQLKTHELKHQKAKMYICDFEDCGLKYINAKKLENHRRLHSLPKEKVFSCEYNGCKYMYDHDYLLRLHYKRTKHNKPHRCPACNCQFREASKCKSHYERVHKNNWLLYNRMMSSEHAQNGIDEDARVENFGTWLGISSLGTEWEDPDVNYSIGSPFVSKQTLDKGRDKRFDNIKSLNASATVDTDFNSRNNASGSKTEPEDILTNSTTLDGHVESLNSRSRSTDCTGLSEFAETRVENGEEQTEEGRLETLTIPDISVLLECKIEPDETELNGKAQIQEINVTTTQPNLNSDELVSEIGCFIDVKKEIKQEFIPELDSITDEE